MKIPKGDIKLNVKVTIQKG